MPSAFNFSTLDEKLQKTSAEQRKKCGIINYYSKNSLFNKCGFSFFYTFARKYN